MRKDVFVIFLLIALFGVSCENKVLMESRNMAAASPSPTPDSKERPSEEFLRHYHEGLKIKVNGKFPDDVPKAIEEFKKASAIDPNDTGTYEQIAELYISVKQYEDAEAYLRKIIEKDSEDAIAHWTLTKILIEHLDKYEEGLQQAIIAEKLYGNDGLSFVRARLIGKAYDGLKDYENAVKHYKTFLKGLDSPDADDYKETKKRVSELEKITRNSNSKQ